MTNLHGYDAFHTILTRLRDAVTLELQNRNALPKRTAILTGAIAWDECENCGLFALSAQRHYLSDTFPIEEVQVPVASIGPYQGAFLGCDMALQIVRCSPQPQGRDLAPSVEALDRSAQTIFNDAFTLLCVTTTQLQLMKKNNDIEDYLIRQCVYAGPEGACVGSELTFAVGVDF